MSERSRARHKDRHLRRLSILAGHFYDDAAARDDGKNDARKVAAVPGAREIEKAYLESNAYHRQRIELFKPATA